VSTQTERLNAALAGRYRIERHLGEGGMASVYLAFDEKHDRRVALKLLKPELAAVLGAERFVQEIKTTAALQHPHILPLFDSGTADGFLFYVMPFIDGETLRSKLDRETQLGVSEAVRIAREVADALDYAHRHGVIHRDIKPENILLTDGRALVADFGIALAVSAAAGGRMTETGLSLGTPHYMSPEQATADKEITARSDVYSLASVLYEMLTGDPPHTGASAQQIIMKIITAPTEPVTKHRKSVPQNVVDAVAMALEKLPADRFESAKEFSQALGNPTYTGMTSVGVAASQRTGMRRLMDPPMAIATSIATVAVLVGIWGWTRPAPVHEVSRFSVLLPDSQGFASGNVTRLAISPDGRRIVYLGPGQSSTTPRLWIRSLDQLNAVPIPGTENGGNPSFSPDGKKLAFTSFSPRAVKVVSLAGGPAITLTDSLVDLGGLTWGTDGYVYYDGHLAKDGVARVSETGGSPEAATTPNAERGELFHNMPSALPDGRGVLFTIARTGGMTTADIGVLDSRTGEHKVLGRGIGARYAASGHIVYVSDAGALMAAPFDLDRLEFSGDAVAIGDGVAVRGTQRVDVAISGTGTLTYIQGPRRTGEAELTWGSRDGKITSVDRSFTGPFITRIALSPDGRRAAVSLGTTPSDASIWVKELDAGSVSKIADAGISPTWSNDGQSIMFIGRSGTFSIVPSDASRVPRIVRAPATSGGATNFDWSDDGKWVAFIARADLYAFQLTGDTIVRELLATPAVEGSPQFSPDSKWIAYTSDESGYPVVFVRPFPDVNTAKQQVSLGAGFTPQWSRDGKELLYLDDQLNLISVAVTTGARFSMGARRTVLSELVFPVGNRSFDIAPDRRILLSRPLSSDSRRPDELILVQNAFDELRAKAPRK
jgi:serine/threonine protein kinase/Tol biopolymer transport system component